MHPSYRQKQPIPRTAHGRDFNTSDSTQIIQSHRVAENAVLHDIFLTRRIDKSGILFFHRLLMRSQQPERAVHADAPALGTGSRTDIHEPVGCFHRLLIMLHYHHRIAAVTKFLQGSNQFAVVPLVQPD